MIPKEDDSKYINYASDNAKSLSFYLNIKVFPERLMIAELCRYLTILMALNKCSKSYCQLNNSLLSKRETIISIYEIAFLKFLLFSFVIILKSMNALYLHNYNFIAPHDVCISYSNKINKFVTISEGQSFKGK